jgi:hypothetical protein
MMVNQYIWKDDFCSEKSFSTLNIKDNTFATSLGATG